MSLRFKLQLVAVADDGSETSEEVVVLDKEHERLAQLGLTLAEGKQLLREVQRRVLEQQVTAFLSRRDSLSELRSPARHQRPQTAESAHAVRQDDPPERTSSAVLPPAG